MLGESAILYLIFSPGSLCYSDVYRCESGRCCTLPFVLTFSRFSFYKKPFGNKVPYINWFTFHWTVNMGFRLCSVNSGSHQDYWTPCTSRYHPPPASPCDQEESRPPGSAEDDWSLCPFLPTVIKLSSAVDDDWENKLLETLLIYKENWKGKLIKNVRRSEESDTYLIHVCIYEGQ